MSRWLDIAARDEVNSNSLTDTQQEPAKSRDDATNFPFLMVSAGCREGNSGEGLPLNEGVKNHPNSKIDQISEACPYGVSPGGRPLTFMGKVVSLEAWRELSEWEKHGPNGKAWNGNFQQWEVPE